MGAKIDDPANRAAGRAASAATPAIQEQGPVEIHKPKAVHGWRELANEIGVIVIGVLIALGAEQAVEALHWRHQVEAGEDALREDARHLIDSGALREAQSPCLALRLAAIADVLDRASASGRLPAVGQLGSPSWSPWKFASWDGLVASQVTFHMPRDRMLDYAEIASIAARLAQLNSDERQAWTDMYTIVGPGRPFGEAGQTAARAALSRAVIVAKDQLAMSRSMRTAVSASGLLAESDIAAIRKKAGEEYVVDARDGIMCKPLADAPPADRYGQAPSRIDLSAPYQP